MLGLPIALVSLITLAVMIAGALVLGLSAHHEDIHMKSVLLDTLADAAAADGVLAAVIGYVGVRLAVQAVAALRGADND